MFLAGKVEETPRSLKDVIFVSYQIRHKRDKTAVQRIKHKVCTLSLFLIPFFLPFLLVGLVSSAWVPFLIYVCIDSIPLGALSKATMCRLIQTLYFVF